jgi:hypothetical protein
VYIILACNSERKRSLGRPKHRWGGLMNKVLRKLGGRLWIGLEWPKIGSSGVLF